MLSSCGPTIRVAPVGDTYGEHDQGIFLHFVHCAVIAHANAPQPAQATLQRIPRERVLRQRVDRLDEPLASRRGTCPSSRAALLLILIE